MAIQGFNKEFYLNAKLAQLQANSETAADWAGKDVAFLEARLLNGFGLTAEAHYEQFGFQEGLAPNAFFNPAEYIRAKATAMFNDAATSYLTIDEAAADFVAIWNGNVYNHYLQFGEAEGVNPSNTFDVSGYYEAKLAQLQAAGNTEFTTTAQVKAAFDAAGLTALGHFVAFGQNEGITAPAVPEGERVSVDTSVPGQTFTLTAGIDTLTGTAGNDTFNSSVTDGGTATQTLTGLDSIDGGAGIDTLNVDFGSAAAVLPTTATIRNIEVLNAATVSTTAASNLDVSGNADIKTVMLANGGTQNSTVKGGEDVTVNGGAVTNVSGTALKSVTVNKAAGDNGVLVDAVISNDTTAAAGVGTTLTSVTLNDLGATAATATIAGNAVDTVSVNNQKSALATTITNAVSKELTVNVDGSGYNAAGTAVAGVSVAAGAAAENITVNATGAKSNVEVTAAAAKNLTLTGSADLKLGGVTTAALTSINGSAATGGLDLGALNIGTANVTTGAGNDKFEVTATKVTVDAGAGNDTVTLGSAIAVGSTINLGAGNDVLLSNSGSVAANTTAASTVIDGGEGIDTVAASLINATNATQFVNFERIDASTGTNTLDLNLMTGSAIEGVTLNGGAGTVSLQNLAAGSDLTVAGANTGTTTIGLKGAAAGTNDAFTINFDGANVAATATAANVTAGTVVTNGVEALTINSNGGTNTWNSTTITDDKLQTLAITGEQNLDLAFAGTNGTNVAAGGGAVNLIDGSAATGKLAINLSNVTADNSATGLTVKGGSAADLITTNASSSTLTGNGGNDSFVVTSTVAGGNTAAAVAKTTITDFAAGDKITGLVGAGDIAKIDLTASVQSLDDAFALLGDNTGTNDVQWFNYGQSTYVVYNDAAAGLSTGDVVVELTGTYDLSNATVAAGVLELA